MQLRTLGRFALEGSRFHRPKLWLLLAYLAMEGACERHFLAELFWRDAAQPMTSLRVALAQLRCDLPDSICTDGHCLQAKLPVDAAELLKLLNTGNYSAAVNHYTGPFLHQSPIPKASTELEDWVYSQRESIADRVAGAHLALGEQAAKAGDTSTAVTHAAAAWHLPGASPFDLEDLQSLYTLLNRAGSPLARDVRREAATYGLSLTL